MQDNSTRSPHFPANLDDYAPWVATHGLTAPYGRCQCGCGGTALLSQGNYTSLGYVKGEPRRFLWGHHMRVWYGTDEERFWEKVDKRSPVECWEWQAVCNARGYGLFRYEGKSALAHRFSYILHHGDLPDGDFVLHSCDNPACINPHHLFAGSHTDNMADMTKKGRQLRGVKSWSAKLTNTEVKEIRKCYAQGEYQQSIADSFGVSVATISMIVNRKIWKHVE